MKYFFPFFILMLVAIQAPHAYAGPAGQAQEMTQLLNNGLLIVQKNSGIATQINTVKSLVDQTITRPLSTMLITVAQQQAASDILNWANGGTNGNSLIIANPEKYIRDAGTAAAKQALNDLPEDSVYGASVFASLVDRYKDKDPKAVLASIAQSEIPSLVQENICNDQKLTALALLDVQNADGSYVNAELTKRKNELYNYACKGDPKSDPALATKLNDLNQQNPNIGGWDTFLAQLDDNQYTASVRAKNYVDTQKETKSTIATKDLYDKPGPVSQTKCNKESTDVKVGEEPFCEDAEVITPGSIVGTAVSNANNSGLDRLTNLMEGGLTGLLTNIAMKKLTSGLRSALNSKSSSSGGSSGSPTTVSVKSPPTQDLVGDTDTKSSITGPMMQQFNNYDSSLNTLLGVDRDYLNIVNDYQTKITSGRDCYDGLIQDGTLQATDPRAISAYDFYNDRQSRIDSVKNSVLDEIKKATNARALIKATITLINNSNSTQEISETYNTYSQTVANQKYPQSEASSIREDQANQTKSQIDNDKDADTYLNTCIQMGGTNSGGGSPGA